MIVNGKELTKKARAEGYGIGAFNARDYVGVETILRAGEELGTPLMIQVGDFADPNAQESRRMSPFEANNLMKFICQRSEASPIPVIIHLDHCPTFEGCMRAIQAGATSVMIDASMKSFEENVAMTNKVIEAARGCNVAIEAEIGHVSGHANSTGVQYTSVAGAKAFYEATGVDMLAVSIGTVHGVYTTEPSLQYELIAQLRDAIPCPLVMHGSSGLVADQYRKAVKNGIVKINFATYLQLIFGAEIRDVAAAAGDKAMFSPIISAGMKRGTEYVKEHIGYFGTKKAV